MRTICAMRFARASVARTIARVVAVAADVGERVTDSEAALAVARRDRERSFMHDVFSAFRSGLALLDRAYAADRRGLVFSAKFETPVAAQPAPRLRRRS